MTEYVLGFLFNKVFDLRDKSVILIQKNKPSFMAGKLNGVGGHVEPGESATYAMTREFKEEAGVENISWHSFGTLTVGNDARIFLYSATNEMAFWAADTSTDERIVKMPLRWLEDSKRMPNLDYLIPLAISNEIRHELGFDGVFLNLEEKSEP